MHLHRGRLATLGLVTLAIAAANCGGSTPLSAREFRQRVDSICSAAADDMAQLPVPATLDALSSGYLDLFTVLHDANESLQPLDAPDSLSKRADNLDDHIDDAGFAFSEVRSATESREFDDADAAIAEGQQTLAAIDGLGAALGVPECSATAFGAEHFANAATLVASARQAEVPTGDFVTDANAACTRFGEDLAEAPPPIDPVNFQLYVSTLQQAFDLLGRDIGELDPPPGADAQVDELVATIDRAVEALAKAGSSVSTSDEEQIAGLQRELGELGDELTAQAAALGLTC